MNRVLIGDRADGTPGDYPGDSDGIRDALADGHRWLVFDEASIQIESTVSLTGLPNRFLRLEGSMVRGTIFDKQDPNGQPRNIVMLEALDEWVFQWRGITFTGGILESTGTVADCNTTNLPTTGPPMMVVKKLVNSRFEQCAWVANGGVGMDLGSGGGWTRNVLFQSCEILMNCLEGAKIYGARGLDFMKCMIERNGRRDVKNIPDLVIRGDSSDPFRGTSVIRDCHFEADDVEHIAIDLDDVRAVDIIRNYVTLSDLRLGAGTANCLVARNRFNTGGNTNEAGDVFVHTQSSSNQVPASGQEANMYVDGTVSFKAAKSYS